MCSAIKLKYKKQLKSYFYRWRKIARLGALRDNARTAKQEAARSLEAIHNARALQHAFLTWKKAQSLPKARSPARATFLARVNKIKSHFN